MADVNPLEMYADALANMHIKNLTELLIKRTQELAEAKSTVADLTLKLSLFTPQNINHSCAESPVSFADSKLQADIEALTKRVTVLEKRATTTMEYKIAAVADSAQDIGKAVHAIVDRYIDQQTRIGGRLRSRGV